MSEMNAHAPEENAGGYRQKGSCEGESTKELLDCLPCGICCFEIEKAAKEEYVFRYANEILCGYFGANVGEMNPELLKEHVFQKDLKNIRKLAGQLQVGERVKTSLRIKQTAKETAYIQAVLSRRDTRDGRSYLLIVAFSMENFVEKYQGIRNKLNAANQEKRRLSELIEELPVGMAILRGGDELQIESLNREFLRPFGYSWQEFKANAGCCNMKKLIYGPDLGILQEAQQETMRQNISDEKELRILTQSGKIFWIMMKMHLSYYKDAVPHYLIVNWNINDRKRVEDELLLQTERYQMLEKLTDEIPFELDIEAKQILMPVKLSHLENFPGQRETYVMLDKFIHMIHPDDRRTFDIAMREAGREERSGNVEYRLETENGKTKRYSWFRTNYKSICGGKGQIIRVIGRTYNIDEEKEFHVRMQEKIRRDPLTNLLNKVALRSDINGFLKEKPKGIHALFILDIDRFKQVNDGFGHTFGDTVIENTAEKLEKLFRGSDYVGRVGGDEFVVFMKETGYEQAGEKANGICEKLKQTYKGDYGTHHITVSVGLAFYPKDGDDYETLFNKADQAMYQAKNQGRNGYAIADKGKFELGAAGIGRQVEDDKKAGYKDSGLLGQAFSLLSHARDYNGSLGILLERIGRKYHLSKIMVFEFDQKRKAGILINYWAGNERLAMTQLFEGEPKTLKNIEQEKIVCMEDSCAPEIGEKDRKRFEKHHIRAMVTCLYSQPGSQGGYVCYVEGEQARRWTEYEKNTFLEMSKVISVFGELKKRMEENSQKIRLLEDRDSLTGLFNQNVFLHRAQECLNRWDGKGTYAVLHMDLNDFAYVNENFGYESGNMLLKSFAKEIAGFSGVLAACRLYSDYFVIFVKISDTENLEKRINRQIDQFVIRQRRSYPSGSIGLSVGLYMLKDPREDLEEAVENANLARKKIKDNRHLNLQIYNTGLREAWDLEQKVSGSFYEAIRQQEIVMFLQPKFYLGTKKIYGAEALARWRRQDGTYTPPMEFIPVLEKLGYVTDLDFYIYEVMVRTLQKWQQEGKNLITISTNFSGHHFEHGGRGFIHRVCEIAREYGVDPKYIELELTESVIINNFEEIKKDLTLLQEKGFRIAMDDFGTGYSSLNALLEIPVNAVKLDQSFMRNGEQGKREEFIVRMGQFLKETKEEIIFEGIETEEQLDFLKKGGFRFGQGYIFDRPVTVSEFEEKYIR